MADRLVSEASVRWNVWVQVPFSAPKRKKSGDTLIFFIQVKTQYTYEQKSSEHHTLGDSTLDQKKCVYMRVPVRGKATDAGAPQRTRMSKGN